MDICWIKLCLLQDQICKVLSEEQSHFQLLARLALLFMKCAFFYILIKRYCHSGANIQIVDISATSLNGITG